MTTPPNPAASDDHVLVQLSEFLAARLVPDGAPVDPREVVQLSRAAIPRAEHVAVTLLRPQRPPTSVAVSGPLPRLVDELQYRLGDGPCLDAATGPSVTWTGDVGADERWPVFGPRCVEETGVRSILAVRLPVGGEDHAALNVYSSEAFGFGDDDAAAASLIAPYVALVVESHLHRKDVENLTSALESSRTIGTAVGILMTSRHLTKEAAFALLRRASMDLNLKLRDVASEVEMTGELP